MKIGLDMSVIQTPHRMRGVGATAINFIAHIPSEIRQAHSFVLYMYEEDQADALKALQLDGLQYEVRRLTKRQPSQLRLPVRLRIINSLLNVFRGLVDNRRGDQRGGDYTGVDCYLQFDQLQTPPKVAGLRTATILYDLIPFIMEADYLPSYRTARHKQSSRRSSLKQAVRRRRYIGQARFVARTCDQLFAISEYTKQDYVRFAGINPDKIQVAHLGVSDIGSPAVKAERPDLQYVENSWGYFQQPVDLTTKPFLLFVGGADPRRRLTDLIGAYNNLRAQGHDIGLVLAGDTMRGPKTIPIVPVQKALLASSYLDDISFLGFVTDSQREWLYEHALAMVYPSVYEGFGLPVLEAMRYGTPVITYDNSSIREIADNAAMYAHDARSIKLQVDALLTNPELSATYKKHGQAQAAQFSWTDTTEKLFRSLLS